MSSEANGLAHTVKAMRSMVPAKDFDISKRFYEELGFRPEVLIPDRLVEMRLGRYAFILQNYYVQQWADNSAIHLRVADLRVWWDHIVSLDLTSRYGVRTREPRQEDWGLVAVVIDPSGVLWQFAESPDENPD